MKYRFGREKVVIKLYCVGPLGAVDTLTSNAPVVRHGARHMFHESLVYSMNVGAAFVLGDIIWLVRKEVGTSLLYCVEDSPALISGQVQTATTYSSC